jgi:hypothetical protein
MPRLKQYSSEEVADLPGEIWVKQEAHREMVKDLQRQMTLMFSPHHVICLLRERDTVQRQLFIYEAALTAIAQAGLRTFNADTSALNEMVAQTVQDLTKLHERGARKQGTGSNRKANEDSSTSPAASLRMTDPDL